MESWTAEDELEASRARLRGPGRLATWLGAVGVLVTPLAAGMALIAVATLESAVSWGSRSYGGRDGWMVAALGLAVVWGVLHLVGGVLGIVGGRRLPSDRRGAARAAGMLQLVLVAVESIALLGGLAYLLEFPIVGEDTGWILVVSWACVLAVRGWGWGQVLFKSRRVGADRLRLDEEPAPS